MSKEERKRMEQFINATLKPNKPNEYRLGYEYALRKCYYLVDDLQQRIDKAIEFIKENFDKTGICVSGSDLSYSYIEELLEILGGKENE